MSTNQDINMVVEFLNKEEVFEYFQAFLEEKEIAATEAESIISTLEHEDE